MALDPDAAALARFLQRHGPVLALTGAGISTASGLPDFRSPGGLWERLDPMVDGHVDMLSRDPARVWQCWAEPLVGARILPNPAHEALAKLEAGGFVAGVVTQNIDGLHHASGSDAVEVHGHLRTASCLACGAEEEMAPALARYADNRRAPECLVCGGDTAAAGRSLRRAPARRWPGVARRRWRRAPADACASAPRLQVYPAAGLAEAFVHARRPLAIVSQQPTGLWREADPRLQRAAEDILPAVAALLAA